MGWLSKILGGSNRNGLDERCKWSYETENQDATSCGNTSSEFEDTDNSIEDQRGDGFIDGEARLQYYELLSMKNPGRLDSQYLPKSSSGNDYGTGYGYEYTSDLYQPVTIPYSTSYGICAGCNLDVGNGRYLSCMNALWHPECFRCRGCTHPISDSEFSVYENYPYHKSCYKESHHPRCDVCRHIIPTNASGFIEFRALRFWSQKYCPRHEQDGTPRCCSCERMETWNTRFAALNDGRNLCPECLNSAVIMSDKECQPLFRDIQKFFKGLNMKVTQQIPLLLVDKPALYEAMGGEMPGHHHCMPETRGICLAEEHTVNTILKRPRIRFGSRKTSTRTQPYKVTKHCQVSAILIVYGLPRLLTGIILAHEMMHAWLRLNGFQNLNQDVEEGICQVMACLWLESQMESMSNSTTTSSNQGSGSSFERKLGEFYKEQIATDSSAVYGNGFRAGHEAVSRLGLPRTLDHMHRTGRFPC